MATIESSANFSGKNWGGYCRLTYTSGNGAINITGMDFKATNSTSAGYGAYYDNQQNITVTAGGQSRSCTLRYVRIKQTSYYSATFSGASFSGLSGNTTVSFTCRARGDSPNTLTFTYIINAGSAVVAPSVSGLWINVNDETSISAGFNIDSDGGASATPVLVCNGQTSYSTSATFSGLNAGQSYTVTAYAANSAGNSNVLSDSRQTYYYPHVTGCTSATIGDPITITVYNELGRNYYLELISTNNNQVVATYQGTSKNPTGFNTQTQQNNMYASIPNTKSGQYRTRLTWNGHVHEWDSRGYGNYYVNESACKPTFSNFIWEDINPTTLALTGSNSTVIKNKSNIQVTIPVADKATPQKYASGIKRYEFRCGSKTSTDPMTYSSSADVTGTISEVPSAKFEVKAVDSREVSSEWVAITAQDFVDYTSLSKTRADVHRVGEVSEQVTLEFEGQIDLENFGDVTNSIKSVTYQYKTGSNQYVTGDTAITPTVNANGKFTFTGNIKGDTANGFSVENVYSIILTVSDELSSVSWTLTLNAGSPHLAWHKNGLSVMGKYNESAGGKFQIAGVNLFDLIFPVGYVYLSMNDTNPATLFGVGTWERLSGGFLYGAVNNSGNGNGTGTSTNNYTGNTGSHAITWNEMPSHTHDRGTYNITGSFRTREMTNGSNIAEATAGAFGWTEDGGGVAWYQGLNYTSGTNLATDLIWFDGASGWTGSSGSAGSDWGHDHSMTHNHAVPYMAVFVWKRTA